MLVSDRLRLLSASSVCSSVTVGDCLFLMDDHCLVVTGDDDGTGTCRVSNFGWDRTVDSDGCSSLWVLSLVSILSKGSTSLRGRAWAVSDSRPLMGPTVEFSTVLRIKVNGNSTAFPM